MIKHEQKRRRVLDLGLESEPGKEIPRHSSHLSLLFPRPRLALLSRSLNASYMLQFININSAALVVRESNRPPEGRRERERDGMHFAFDTMRSLFRDTTCAVLIRLTTVCLSLPFSSVSHCSGLDNSFDFKIAFPQSLPSLSRPPLPFCNRSQ